SIRPGPDRKRVKDLSRSEVHEPGRQTLRSAGRVHASVDRHSRRSHLTILGRVADSEEVGHLERSPRGRGQGEMHVDLLVEPQRLAVLHETLQYCVVETGGAQLRIRMAEM